VEVKLESNQSRVGLQEATEGGGEKGWKGEIWWKRETEVAGGEAAAGVRPPPLSLSLLRSGQELRTRRSRGGCECALVDGPTRRRRPGRLGYVPSDRDGSRGINNWMGTLPFGFSRTDSMAIATLT
jgi:hypothetical protein